MSSPAAERVQRAITKNKSYVDLTVDSEDGSDEEVQLLQSSKRENGDVSKSKRKRVSPLFNR
jgi:hypothetical protein